MVSAERGFENEAKDRLGKVARDTIEETGQEGEREGEGKQLRSLPAEPVDEAGEMRWGRAR
jgi:hypothetical protein